MSLVIVPAMWPRESTQESRRRQASATERLEPSQVLQGARGRKLSPDDARGSRCRVAAQDAMPDRPCGLFWLVPLGGLCSLQLVKTAHSTTICLIGVNQSKC